MRPTTLDPAGTDPDPHPVARQRPQHLTEPEPRLDDAGLGRRLGREPLDATIAASGTSARRAGGVARSSHSGAASTNVPSTGSPPSTRTRTLRPTDARTRADEHHRGALGPRQLGDVGAHVRQPGRRQLGLHVREQLLHRT